VKLGDLQTPALLIRLDRVRNNLERMRDLLAPHGGLARWRPHVKTTKIPEVLRLLLDLGLRSFKCSTTREALVMLELARAAGVKIDLLVAMTHRGANLARVAALAREFPDQRLSILTEDGAHAREVRALDVALGLFVDLDPRYGRSGIPLGERARIAAAIDACGDALTGLHCYEGQVREASVSERTLECGLLFEALCETVRTHRLEALETVTSGTPTFVQALEYAGFEGLKHTISPGIVVYWDLNSRIFGPGGFTCAASVLSRVISAPRRDRVTLDAGSKSLDAAASDPCVEIVGRPDLRAARPSEEHLPVDVLSGNSPRPGALLELLPRHVCPMINLADEAVLLDGERVLGIVPVAARGHETLERPDAV